VSSSVTGLLLAGVGHVSEPPDSQRNFLIVDQKTETSQVEKAFVRFTKERKDIGILLINQHVRILGTPLRRPLYLPFSGFSSISKSTTKMLLANAHWDPGC
jgi:ATP synthase (F/14-kDa) subunit